MLPRLHLGIAVNTLGHGHPAWVEAVRAQAGDLAHTSNLFRNPRQGELARRLVGYAGPGRVFFCNSGTEANEALIKLARLHGVQKAGGEEKCFKGIGAQGAFHGRTFGAMSATPQEKIQGGFRTLVPGFAFGSLNQLDSFAALIDGDTAAVLVEPIQGEGGLTACTPEFLSGLRQLCDRQDALLLLDEVQCGVGRTGDFFAFEAAGIVPDAIAMAKGLGGGFPISAMWVRNDRAGLFTPGRNGTTFGGNPLACAAALAVLDVIEREDLLRRVREQSGPWHAALRRLAGESPARILAVLGRGYMVGLKLPDDPAPHLARLRELGLLAVAAGGSVIRLLPPLNATAAEMEESVEVLRTVFVGGNQARSGGGLK